MKMVAEEIFDRADHRDAPKGRDLRQLGTGNLLNIIRNFLSFSSPNLVNISSGVKLSFSMGVLFVRVLLWRMQIFSALLVNYLEVLRVTD